jgi:hypothetical protein
MRSGGSSANAQNHTMNEKDKSNDTIEEYKETLNMVSSSNRLADIKGSA